MRSSEHCNEAAFVVYKNSFRSIMELSVPLSNLCKCMVKASVDYVSGLVPYFGGGGGTACIPGPADNGCVYAKMSESSRSPTCNAVHEDARRICPCQSNPAWTFFLDSFDDGSATSSTYPAGAMTSTGANTGQLSATVYKGAALDQAVWTTSVGVCRGGPSWKAAGGPEYHCVDGKYTESACKDLCVQTEACAAIDLDSNAVRIGEASECCLFREGNMGNGQAGRDCMLLSTRTAAAAAVLGQGRFGEEGGGGPKALAFDGVGTSESDGQHVSIDGGITVGGGAISVCAWAKWSAFGYWSRIVDIGNGASSDNILLANDETTSTLRWHIYRGTTAKYFIIGNILELGKWTHICGTVETTGEMKVYVNGMEQACTDGSACNTATGKGTYGHIPNRLLRKNAFIGRSNWGNDAYFSGSIADLTIVDGKALNAAEVADEMYTTCDCCAEGFVCGPLGTCMLSPERGIDNDNACPQHDWTLLDSSYIDLCKDGGVDSTISARGPFRTSAAVAVSYQQVYLECGSTNNVSVQRVITLGNRMRTAGAVEYGGNVTVTGRNYYTNDKNAPRPADVTFQAGTWAELHYFGQTPNQALRFILRDAAIHCAQAYSPVASSPLYSFEGVVGNPNLGTYGRVWVRDSTAIPKEADLPMCIPTPPTTAATNSTTTTITASATIPAGTIAELASTTTPNVITADASTNETSLMDLDGSKHDGGVVGAVVGVVITILIILAVGFDIVWRRRQGDSNGGCSWLARSNQPATRAQRAAFEAEETSRNTFSMVSNPVASAALRAQHAGETQGTQQGDGDTASTDVYYSTVAEAQLDSDSYANGDSFSSGDGAVYATYAGSGVVHDAANNLVSNYAVPSDVGPVYTVPLQHGGVAYAKGAGRSRTAAAEVYANANESATVSSA